MCHKFVLPPVERHGQGENDLLFKEKSCNELTFHAMSEALGVAILTTTEQGTSQRDTKHFSAHDKWRAATVCIIAEDEHSTLALPHQGMHATMGNVNALPTGSDCQCHKVLAVPAPCMDLRFTAQLRDV